MNESDEWVTVAEAARRLGIDQKQVRRYASRLADTDRTASKDTPLTVRMSAVRLLRQQAIECSSILNNGKDTYADTDRTPKGQSAGRQQDSVSALVEQLRSENAFLRAEVERRDQAESELRRLMLADKQEYREEIRRLRQQLAITSAPPDSLVETPEASPVGQKDAQEGTGDWKSAAPSSGVLVEKPSEKGAERAHWWQFWKRG